MMMVGTLIAPDTRGLRPGAQAQDFEYALCDTDNFDTRMYGREAEDGTMIWGPDPCDATWVDGYDQVMELAFSHRLSEPDEDTFEEVLDPWIEIVCRPRFSADDRRDSPAEVPLEGLDFSKLGISLRDFESR